MPAQPATIDAARLAKERVKQLVARQAGVTGVGVTRVGEGYAVKVNVVEAATASTLPHLVDGVPVIAEVVGPVTRR